LAIAYQRKAKEEIEKRLQDRYGLRNVNVGTFHKLGKSILEETGKEFRHTDIVDENKKHEIMQRIFRQKIDNESDFYNMFLKYVKTLHDKDPRVDPGAKDEAFAYAQERTYCSIDHTRVNSQAEKEIMDFFLTHRLNGKPIEVKYEPDIEGFRPDFYLPQYDLFIEHWALSEKGEVPKWFRQSTEKYKETMETKKKWFVENEKVLVETFAHEYKEDNPEQFIELLRGRILQKLQTKHKDTFGFTLKTYAEIVDLVWQSYRTPVDDIANFITTAKTYDLTPVRITERLQNGSWTRKQLAFGNLTLPIYSAYEDILREHGKIDFEDMINSAIDELEKNPNLRANVYDHILIDEYQDISAQRYRLIKKLMERNPKCKLFCVGDDWQSIMSFSGSNLHFFVNFNQYFENPAITTISTNYRNSKTIVDAGAELIKKNTSCQIQKTTTSLRRDAKLIKVFRSPHKQQYERNYHHQTAEDCLSRITNYLRNGYSPKDIIILSRCMRTRTGHGYKFLSSIGTFIEKAKENGLELAYENQEAYNKVRLLTAHKAKGLEARVIFLLNVTSGMHGFPCEIEDPAIYEPARENYPPQDFMEEERRLFYVAITRAMEDLYIYTWEPAMSRFLEEIADYTDEERLSY
jgi:DNA helicase-4